MSKTNAYGMPSGEDVPMVQEGKYYECRNGAIVGPMIHNLSRLYDPEWTWTYRGRSAGELWRDDGTFGARSEYDLMREYIPESD